MLNIVTQSSWISSTKNVGHVPNVIFLLTSKHLLLHEFLEKDKARQGGNKGETRLEEMAFKSKNIKAPLSTHVLQMLEEERKQAHTAVFARDLGQRCRAYIQARWVCCKLIEGDWLESVMTRKCFCFVCSEQKPCKGQQREGERLSDAGGQQRHPITPFTSVQWNVRNTGHFRAKGP